MIERLQKAAIPAMCAVALAGCAAHSADPVPPLPRVIEAEAYRLPSSPDDATSFPLTRTQFSGEVLGQDTAIHATDTSADGVSLDVVYTPVRVRVASVFRGPLRTGQVVTVRIMGGVADGVRYVTDDAPRLADVPAGTAVMVWGTARKQVDVEPGPAITPYFVYRRAGHQYVDVTYGSRPSRAIGVRSLHKRIEAAAARRRTASAVTRESRQGERS